MKIRVKLFASLREGRFDEAELEVPAGGSVLDAMTAAGLREGEATVIFRNARHVDANDTLRDGDVLSFFPPVGGG